MNIFRNKKHCAQNKITQQHPITSKHLQITCHAFRIGNSNVLKYIPNTLKRS